MNSQLLVNAKHSLVENSLVTKIELTEDQVTTLNSEKKFTRTRNSKRIVSELGLDLHDEAVKLVNALIKEHKIEVSELKVKVTENVINLSTNSEYDPASPNTHFTLEEVNSVLNKHPQYIRKMMRAQKIENIKVKGRFYVEKEYFATYCEAKGIKLTIK